MAKKDGKGAKKRKAASDRQADLFGAIGQAARSGRGLLARRLAASGLYAGQDALMLALDAEDGQTPSQIAARLGVRAPTVTKTVNRLAERGFVQKEPSPTDGRLSHVRLTEDGHRAIATIRDAVRASEALAVAGLSGKEVKSLLKLLRKVERNLQAAETKDVGEGGGS